jgi:Na+-driven multidrug efflux pump
LNLLLIPRFGASGSAIASTLSYTAGCILFVVWTARLAGVRATSAIPCLADVQLIARASLRPASVRLRCCAQSS